MCWLHLSPFFPLFSLHAVLSTIFRVCVLCVLGYRVGAVAAVLPVWEPLRLVLLVVNVFHRFSCPFGVFYVLPI